MRIRKRRAFLWPLIRGVLTGIVWLNAQVMRLAGVGLVLLGFAGLAGVIGLLVLLFFQDSGTLLLKLQGLSAG